MAWVADSQLVRDAMRIYGAPRGARIRTAHRVGAAPSPRWGPACSGRRSAQPNRRGGRRKKPIRCNTADTHGTLQPSLAYATSVDKSQGSEYPAVVIPLATQHSDGR